VGDSLRDFQAVLVTGARPVPVRTGNGEEALNPGYYLPELRPSTIWPRWLLNWIVIAKRWRTARIRQSLFYTYAPAYFS